MGEETTSDGAEEDKTMDDSVEHIPASSALIDPAVLNMQHPNTIEHNDHEPMLNDRQRIVHDIVATHLHAYLRGENPPQCLTRVHGQGGMGKSVLLNAISNMFEKLNTSNLLAKTVTSGVAATIVGGQTLHS